MKTILTLSIGLSLLLTGTAFAQVPLQWQYIWPIPSKTGSCSYFWPPDKKPELLITWAAREDGSCASADMIEHIEHMLGKQ